jgi:hypothetical protein
MALSPNLLQFKSSGVYRLEFDKSQTVNIPAETIRLVVGRSLKGPYNTPVLIQDIEQFTQVFGGIDKSLEKKNMFFHRSAIECLSRGPILALNMTSSDDDDKVALFSPATNSSLEGLQSVPKDNLDQNRVLKKYSDVFDTDKFWTPSDSKLLSAADQDDNHAISFVNIKQDPITVIIRQASDVRGFEVQAREWYGEGNVPEGIDNTEYVSDYMVDVFIFKGKFDPALLNNDPTYGAFFNEKGLFKSDFAKFAGLREVTLLAQYTGSLIPEFQDNEGRQLYIETLVNLEARRTGLFCAIQEDELSSIDLVGNGFNIYQDYEVLSHRVEQVATTSINDLTAFGAKALLDPSDNKKLIVSGGVNLTAANLNASNIVSPGKFLLSASAGEFTQIKEAGIQDIPGGGVTIECEGAISKSYEEFEAGAPATFAGSTGIKVVNGNILLTAVPNLYGDLGLNGTYLSSVNNGEYVKVGNIDTTYTNTDHPGYTVEISPSGSTGFNTSYGDNPMITELAVNVSAVSTNFDVATLDPNSRAVMFKTLADGWNWDDNTAGVFTFSKTGVDDFGTVEDGVMTLDAKVGMYVPGDDQKLSRILKIVKQVDGNTTKYIFTTHRPVSSRPGYALKRYEDAAGVYKMFALDGATQTDKTIAELLSAIKPGTGLGNALIDKDNITFRYVIDTFGSLEAGGILNKEELTFLCKERQNASAILNAPMIKELKASTNPSFLNELTGAFDVNNVATGGNLNLNPSALYTLPSINEGATYGFYYGPGLNVIENGKTKVIPPAAYISNNYIDKFSDALPWSIIAGPRRGVVGGTGVQSLEFAFDKNDRDVLEPFGYNPIVFERGVGLTIKGNKTAQQGIQSALSSAHVREALIYIEDGLAEILKNYLFEFNNAQTRLEIKTLADNFMESVKKDGGVYDYRNIMDSSNNTTDVIDNNMGILDTFVEPVKGLEILVSRVTVLNTGEIASGNFA